MRQIIGIFSGIALREKLSHFPSVKNEVLNGERFVNRVRIGIVIILSIVLIGYFIEQGYFITDVHGYLISLMLISVVHIIIVEYYIAKKELGIIPYLSVFIDAIVVSASFLVFLSNFPFPSAVIVLYIMFFGSVFSSIVRYNPLNTLFAGFLNAVSFAIVMTLLSRRQLFSGNIGNLFSLLMDPVGIIAASILLFFYGLVGTLFISTFLNFMLKAARSDIQLQKIEERSASLLENIPGIIFQLEISALGNIYYSYIGARAEEILGEKIHRLKNNPFYTLMFLDKKTFRHVLSMLKRLPSSKEPVSIDVQLNTKKGRRWFTLYTSMTANVVGTFFINAILIDSQEIKETQEKLLKAKEEAENATKAKSAFLAMMSHELRTPLNGVIGMSELLLSEELSPQAKGYLATIKSSGENLLTIINDVLDASRLESGKLKVDIRPCDIKTVLEDVYKTLYPQVYHRDIVFKLVVREEIPAILLTDGARLSQILFNLAGNALKFTRQGEVKIEVIKKEETGSKITLVFRISDTGIGIPLEEQDRIFERFHQVDMRSTRKFPGTGLGLSIARDLVNLLHGYIELHSREGKGTIFNVVIPFEYDRNNTTMLMPFEKTDLDETIEEEDIAFTSQYVEKIENTEKEEQGSLQKAVMALVVDDNPENRKVVEKMLIRNNILVHNADTGKTAIELATKNKYNIIFLDYNMPEMDGLETANAIRNIKINSETPLIVLTGQVLPEDKDSFISKGFDDLLAKPVHLEDIRNLLKKWRII
ncbi:ATP-binding protein [Spirochaetia bacterium 38H-sp]|uniref:histidine kinase n=1 Tax=Rarispira pelagica TaxID=3141764 RepID=A0ABU9U9J9_9SPIR